MYLITIKLYIMRKILNTKLEWKALFFGKIHFSISSLPKLIFVPIKLSLGPSNGKLFRPLYRRSNEISLLAAICHTGERSSPKELNLERRREIKQVGILTASISRTQNRRADTISYFVDRYYPHSNCTWKKIS